MKYIVYRKGNISAIGDHEKYHYKDITIVRFNPRRLPCLYSRGDGPKWKYAEGISWFLCRVFIVFAKQQ